MNMRECLKVVGAPAYQCHEDDAHRKALASFLELLARQLGTDLDKEMELGISSEKEMGS